MKIRTRFAPSPTGLLHIGGARTALFSWLFAKHHKGEFILRIEDTDNNRYKKKSVNDIIDGLKMLRINWNKGPYFQSKNINKYLLAVKKLIDSGHAYKCYCSEKRLNKLHEMQKKKKIIRKYDKKCRYKKKYYKNNKSYVVRFKNPSKGIVSFYDIIRGKISIKNRQLDDFIILRSNKTPTYNFCNVIDDIDMKITHVIRGEEHINNTHKQINIFKSINSEIPIYAHVSMILDNNKKKISKRNNAKSITEYLDEGYLPESIINYLVRLGWSYKNREIFSIKDLINLFSLEFLNKSSSIFDIKKLNWLNRYYIKSLPNKYVKKKLKLHFLKKNINVTLGPSLSKIIELFFDRCNNLKEICESSVYFYKNIDKKKYQKNINIDIIKSLNFLEKIYENLINIKLWNVEKLSENIKKFIIDYNIKFNVIGLPLRISLTGMTSSPNIYKILYIMGKKKSLIRIKKFINFVKSI
ncbi:glutamate--tRNA ligase [Buchnera aphidicola (Taiwanaphis decaspermi)]|uniref:glutamate--tRNA ligase n=1 Tax=Buchnera aphidicola TaxID=9 RepID=UPI0031B88C66